MANVFSILAEADHSFYGIESLEESILDFTKVLPLVAGKIDSEDLAFLVKPAAILADLTKIWLEAEEAERLKQIHLQ